MPDKKDVLPTIGDQCMNIFRFWSIRLGNSQISQSEIDHLSNCEHCKVLAVDYPKETS